MAKITRKTTTKRTIDVVSQETGVPAASIKSSTKLREELLMTDGNIGNLSAPLEAKFADVQVKSLLPERLVAARTIQGLSGKVWARIPTGSRQP